MSLGTLALFKTDLLAEYLKDTVGCTHIIMDPDALPHPFSFHRYISPQGTYPVTEIPSSRRKTGRRLEPIPCKLRWKWARSCCWPWNRRSAQQTLHRAPDGPRSCFPRRWGNWKRGEGERGRGVIAPGCTYFTCMGTKSEHPCSRHRIPKTTFTSLYVLTWDRTRSDCSFSWIPNERVIVERRARKGIRPRRKNSWWRSWMRHSALEILDYRLDTRLARQLNIYQRCRFF